MKHRVHSSKDYVFLDYNLAGRSSSLFLTPKEAIDVAKELHDKAMTILAFKRLDEEIEKRKQ